MAGRKSDSIIKKLEIVEIRISIIQIRDLNSSKFEVDIYSIIYF